MLRATMSREALNNGSCSSKWHVSYAEKSRSPTLFIKSFCTAFKDELSSFKLLTIAAKISLSGCDRGSLFVAYFARLYHYGQTKAHVIIYHYGQNSSDTRLLPLIQFPPILF